jgi:serine/threonine protein kinase
MVGTELASRYRVERPLGEGGMGRVYEAVDLQLGRRVAVKVIRDDLDDPAARARFFREARAAAALSHPHACQLYEVSAEDDPQPFLVMELLEGEPLSVRLERGPMSMAETAAVVVPLMSALAALHRAGLVHRDLKPANVFITPRGVKLLDFGLARRTQRSDALTATALTVPGAVTGTMRHMAPEQITGDPVDARTDIFALGVLLFEMLTGRPPFEAETNAEWLHALLEEDAPSLGDLELRALDPIVARALQRRPADRYESVEQMSADLEGVVGPIDTAAAAVPDSPAGVRAAVLPFRLLQEDTQIAVLQDGIPEALTALLSARPGLKVVSNRVAQEFGESTDLVAVGRALKVDRLLTGAILRAGDEVRVTVQLVDSTDGGVLWSQTSQHVLDNVLTLQDGICSQIVAEMPLTDVTSATPA